MKIKIIMLFLLVTSPILVLGQQLKNQTRNKEVALKIFKAFDTGDTSAFDNLMAPNVVSHSEMPPNVKGTGIQAVKEICKLQKLAFPDIKSTIHTMATAGDTVMIYFTSEGTNTGPFFGTPATNKRIKTEGVDIIRFQNGKAVEHWGVYDNLKMMEQMGMLPPPPPKAPSDKK